MSRRDRKERFAAILHEIDLQPPVEFVDELATTYKSALEIFLEAKPGAISLLKVSIDTEGSQGTQEWTIEKLGFEVDFLATTNIFGVSEVDWIFGRVLERDSRRKMWFPWMIVRSEMSSPRGRTGYSRFTTQRRRVLNWM
jgi:hypothetical protein